MKAVYEDTINLINSLSSDKLKEAHNYLLYLKDKSDWEATLELSSSEILEEIKKGISDIKNGNYVSLNSIRRNV